MFFLQRIESRVWSGRLFEQKPVETQWNFAKEKHLCFHCLSKDHRGKDCRRSQPCNVDGCKLKHQLLHRKAIKPPSLPRLPDPPSDSPREGADPRSTVIVATQSTPVSEESCSLCTVPVWSKANGKKVKVNALLDDASNESFVHENVASLLGIQGSFQKVHVHVLNSKVETFQSMPIEVDLESVSGCFRRTIELKTCPHLVTGTYQVEDWHKKKEQWPHLERCDFPKPAGSGFVDLLIGVDNTDLHYSMADVRGPPEGPVARLGLLGLDMHRTV